MRKIKRSNGFKTSFKRCKKRGISLVEIERFKRIIKLLEEGKPLPKEYRDHRLKGGRKNERECHVTGDLLLIYAMRDDYVELRDIGTHSDFGFGEK